MKGTNRVRHLIPSLASQSSVQQKRLWNQTGIAICHAHIRDNLPARRNARRDQRVAAPSLEKAALWPRLVVSGNIPLAGKDPKGSIG
jgi:hypothetical protein